MHVQPPRRSMFRDAAAIAGGVTVGTTVGNMAGQAIGSLFGRGNRYEREIQQTLPSDYDYNRQPEGPCAYEISQFLQCASMNEDLQVCKQLGDAVKECKRRNRIP